MGVNGLWKLLEPTAKQVQLNSLSTKVLAVDASIWLYNFIKAMLDKQGNTIKGAHIIGFFRRICKLLHFGINPVFVFDGTPPEIKKRIMIQRKNRKVDNETSLANTAEKLLQAQLKLHAISAIHDVDNGTLVAKETENGVTRNKDDYELPDMNLLPKPRYQDPRLISADEIKTFINQHSSSLSCINYQHIHTKEFQSLPPALQHDLILDLKLKSRQSDHQRVQQLSMLNKNSTDFSNQQVANRVERNKLTSTYMDFNENAGLVVNPMKDKYNKKWGNRNLNIKRIASERNKSYVLVKNIGDETKRDAGYTINLEINDPFKQPIISKGEVKDDKPGIFEGVFEKLKKSRINEELSAINEKSIKENEDRCFADEEDVHKYTLSSRQQLDFEDDEESISEIMKKFEKKRYTSPLQPPLGEEEESISEIMQKRKNEDTDLFNPFGLNDYDEEGSISEIMSKFKQLEKDTRKQQNASPIIIDSSQDEEMVNTYTHDREEESISEIMKKVDEIERNRTSSSLADFPRINSLTNFPVQIQQSDDQGRFTEKIFHKASHFFTR